ncbi:MAG: BlaI/MecI/CopY family transcriptional regulator [Blastocatellia bacterium]
MVRTKQNIKLTKFELEIMDELWKLEMASVGEIRQGLPERKRPAYTTVQTIVNRLEDKGAVRRVKKVGNAYVYEAVVTKDAAHRRLINELLDLLGGSRPLMAHLVDEGKVSLEDLRGLEAQLAAQSKAKKGS